MTQNDFNKIRLLLDNLNDQKQMSELAIKAINDFNLRLEIPEDEILLWYSNNDAQKNIELCQNLYLIERAIPYYSDRQRPAWQKRLLYFTATYLIEKYLDHKSFVYNGELVTLRFTRSSGSHIALHAGAGTNSADFYIYPNNKAVFIEYKFAVKSRFTNINDVKEYYSTNKHLHGAKVLIVFLEAEEQFYLIDYKYNSINKLAFGLPAYLSSDDINSFEAPKL